MSNTNVQATLIPLAAAVAGTYNSDTQLNENARGVHVIIDVTVATTTSVVFTIQGFDPVSGKWFTLLTSAAITGTGTTVLTVYPGVTVVSNVAVSIPLPRAWRVNAVAATSTVVTATIGATYCV